MHCKACKEGKAKAVGVDEGNRELTTQLSRFSFLYLYIYIVLYLYLCSYLYLYTKEEKVEAMGVAEVNTADVRHFNVFVCISYVCICLYLSPN